MKIIFSLLLFEDSTDDEFFLEENWLKREKNVGK